MNNLDWKKFEPLFGTWALKIKPFFDLGGFDKIYEFLKKESKRGKEIAPMSSLVFRAFRETDINTLKVVIVGLAPYHTFYNGSSIADGLCMSCSITSRLQPSLSNFYNAIERELYNGLNLNMYKNPDLTYLARDGILLLNYALTTSKNKPGDHCVLWEPFMKFLFEQVLDTIGAPVIFLGREAAKLERYTMPFNWIFKLSHPASASYQGIEWDSEGTFKTINKILWERNKETINWLQLDSINEKEIKNEDKVKKPGKPKFRSSN